MRCNVCGTEYEKGQEYCQRCGAQLPVPDVPFFVENPNQQTGRTQQPQSPDYSHDAHGRQEKTFDDESIRRFLIGFGIVSAVVLVLVAALVIYTIG